MANTQAATDGNISKTQAKIDAKLEAIDKLLKDTDALRKENIKQASINWFCGWTSKERNLESLSKASDTYKINVDQIINKLSALQEVLDRLKPEPKSGKKVEKDYEALYKEEVFRNKMLTEDLISEQEAQEFLEQEIARKNAVIKDKSELLEKAEKKIAELTQQLKNSRPSIQVVK